MVFQNYALFPHLDVAANIGFGLAARGMRRRELAERVAEAARLAGCDAFLDRKPFRLSGGERQRVALARALARRPDVFLLDEPLSNLDAQLRAATRAELKALHQRVGGTMLYVTHDQVEALTLGDRDRRAAGGRAAAGRGSGRALPAAGQPLRRLVRRQPGDELPAAAEAGRSTSAGTMPRSACAPRRSARRRATSWPQVEVVEPAGNETFVHLGRGRPAAGRRAPRADVRPEVGASVRGRARPTSCTSSTPRPASGGDPRRRAARARAHAGALPARARRARARPGRDHLLARALRVRPDPVARVGRDSRTSASSPTTRSSASSLRNSLMFIALRRAAAAAGRARVRAAAARALPRRRGVPDLRLPADGRARRRLRTALALDPQPALRPAQPPPRRDRRDRSRAGSPIRCTRSGR